MPRMPALKSELVKDLASRLRYVPAEAARRQLLACEKLADRLAEELHGPASGGAAEGASRGAGTRAGKGERVEGPVRSLERWFPWDWVLGEITGFANRRERGTGGGEDDTQVIEGRTLLADLCALCEYLSVAARGTIDRAPSTEWLTIEELCARWGVSRRTIERWRASGLHARRVTAPPGSIASLNAQSATSRSATSRSAKTERTAAPSSARPGKARGSALLERVVFARSLVETFEQRQGFAGVARDATLTRKATPAHTASNRPGQRDHRTQLTDERLLALARRFARWKSRPSARRSGRAARTPAGVQAFADALAPRAGVSAATIRRRLRALEATLAEPLFPAADSSSALGTPIKRSRATAARTHWRERFDRLRRCFTAWRATHQPAIEAATFVRPDAPDVLLATPGAMGVMNAPPASPSRSALPSRPVASARRTPRSRDGSPACDLDADWPASVEDYIALATQTPAPDAEHELQAAAAYHFLLFDARNRLREVPATKLAQAVERIECRLLWASRLKARMLRAQLGAILRSIESGLAEATGQPAPRRLAELADAQALDLLRAALDAAAHAFERFDPFKGGRLAAPIALAVARAVSQWTRTHGRRAGRMAPATPATALDDAGSQTSLPAAGDLASTPRLMHPWQEFLEPPASVRARVRSWPPSELRTRALLMRWGWASAHAGGLEPRSETKSGPKPPPRSEAWPELGLDSFVPTPPQSAAEVARALHIAVTRVRAFERTALREAGRGSTGQR